MNFQPSGQALDKSSGQQSNPGPVKPEVNRSRLFSMLSDPHSSNEIMFYVGMSFFLILMIVGIVITYISLDGILSAESSGTSSDDDSD